MIHSTNQLEEILLKKEIDSLNAEITKGMVIIRAAFEKYGLSSQIQGCGTKVTDEDLNQFHEYVNNIKIAGAYYFSGYNFKPVYPTITESNPPDFLKKVLAKYAVMEFMTKVEQVEEVRYLAEQALNQSQGN